MSESFHTQYRPQSFDEVLGQPETIKSLKKVVTDKRAHSFIFSGPSGTGKTTLARILAKEFAGAGGGPTNRLEFPASEKSGKDDVKQVLASANYRALGSSPVKTIIVDEAHRLSSAAWDAFLKPVEEPMEHVFFCFCTTDPAKIPKAIQTRCLRYELKPVDELLLAELLIKVVDAERLLVKDEIIEAIAENSNGSPRQALVYLEACLYAETVNDARKIMLAAGQSKEVIDFVRWIVNGKGLNWATGVKYVKAFDSLEAESARLVLLAYISAVLLNTTDEKKAAHLLGLIECFKTPYHQSEKMAPFLYSLGMALGMDR